MLHLALLQWLHERDAGGQEHAQQGGRHGQAAQRVTADLYLVYLKYIYLFSHVCIFNSSYSFTNLGHTSLATVRTQPRVRLHDGRSVPRLHTVEVVPRAARVTRHGRRRVPHVAPTHPARHEPEY